MPTLPPAQKRQQELQQALALHKAGRLDDAAAIYKNILKKDARDFDANHYLGMVLVQQQNFDQAIFRLQTATRSNPQSAVALSNLGAALMGAGRVEDAVEVLAQAVALKPDFRDAHIKHMQALFRAKREDEAAEVAVRVLALGAPDADTAMSCFFLCHKTGRDDLAVQAIAQALAAHPAHPRAVLEHAHILRRQKKFPEAIDAYSLAATLDPDNPDVYFYWGLLLYDLGRYDAAVNTYNHLIALSQHENGAVYQARAEALRRLDRAEEALADYDRAAALLPNDLSLAVSRLHAKMKICDWSLYDQVPDLMARLRADDAVTPLPFPLVALPVSAQDQKLCAERYVRQRFDVAAQTWAMPDYGHKKIRVAYVSADFHRHATLFLMAGMFEAHDKERFEVIAVSLGRDDGSVLRKRVIAAVDTFIDAQQMSDDEVTALLRERQCDIVVDLKGFTMDARAGIFLGRHAPVQVAYIGYPGTCALPNIDYFIGDGVAITPDIEAAFSEKIVYLPHSYQVNDSKRAIAAALPARADLGLPERGFVYCSFNNSYKFTPDVFSRWMNILRRVDGSVLWLLADSALSMDNMRAAAQVQGIVPERIIFAPKIDAEAHLARLACADMFLDSLPCNAHTTASDALWAGLPVLTCAGDTFAGRVAASLLTAAQLPELIVRDLDAYEERAVELALDASRYGRLRQKLADSRMAVPLFDTVRTTRNIERAYAEMMRRFRAGLAPDHIYVRED